jgi:transcriptional regulator with XRE-family HTH domain
MPTLGETIRQEREKQQLSQEQLAKMLDVSQQAVANWEAGSSQPRRDRLDRLLQILGRDKLLATTPPMFTKSAREVAQYLKPTQPALTRDEAIAAFEESHQRVRDMLDRIEHARRDLRDALPERLHQYLDRKIAVGATARQLDYLSPRFAIEIKRAPSNKYFTWQQFAPAMLQLVVARSIAQVIESKREYVLIVVNESNAPMHNTSMQRVMFDAGVLGITAHSVSSMTAAGHLIDRLEAEPPEESTARAEFSLGALTLDATGEADSDHPSE